MRLPTDKQIERIVKLTIRVLREEGLPVAGVDILDNGVRVLITSPDQGGAGTASAYDDWKKQDHDRAAPRQNAA
ncbi:MAG: hypothetical protein U0975_16180 [Erythrobacter sp.]|nr:hypothetical protein [Erythrobacter sp.]MDZ4274199.1 hypothetical protein [Erythrobacter sp.]